MNMGRILYRSLKNLASIILLAAVGLGQVNSPVPASSSTNSGLGEHEKTELVNKLDQLLEQNQKLEDQARQVEEQNRRLLDSIREIREKLAGQPVAGSQAPQQAPQQSPAEKSDPDPANTTGYVNTVSISGPPQPNKVSVDAGDVSVAQEAQPEEKKKWGTYTPNLGFKLAETKYGDLNVSIYTYTRYLNQRLLNATYTNAFGVTTTLQQRQDFQLQKLQIKFLGWMLNPKFRYFLYAWTSNPTQGQGAQVVLAGNLGYTFNKHFTLSAGITCVAGHAECGRQLSLLAGCGYPSDR